MRKLKRLIALVTVAMFLLSLAPGAFAAAPTKEDSFFKLKALGVAYGDQNGDPMYDKNYTRAEAAALMVQLSGMGNAINAAKGATKFSDVPASHWASGVINLAVGAGIIKGYPNGTYKPDANVTYAEMCAMLIQVLGYGPKLQGVWPANVIGKAAELDLLEGVSVDSYNAPAIRGLVFIACNNALDVKVLSEDDNGDLVKLDTLLAEKFEASVVEDELRVVTWGKNADGQFTLTLDADNDGAAAPDADDETITLAENAVVEGGTVPSLINDFRVNYILNDDDEAIYIDLVSSKIFTDDVKIDGTKLKVNGKNYTADNAAFTVVQNGEADEAAGLENQFYKLYLDEDNKIYKAVKAPNGATNPKMVENIKSNKTVEVMVGSSEDLDVDDLLIVKDGKIASIDDLKKTDLIYVSTTVTGLDKYVEAFTTSKKGTLEAAYDTKGDADMDVVKISGKKYDLAPNFVFSTDDGETWDGDASDVDDLYDQEFTFALDKSGDVRYIIAGTKADSNVIYGVVDDFDYSVKDVVTSIDLTTSAGTAVTYSVNTDEVDLDTAADSKNDDAEDGRIALNTVVKITLDANGKIDSYDVQPLVAGTIDDANKDLKKVLVAGTWRYTTADTKVIDIVADDDAEVVSTADFLNAVEAKNAPTNVDAFVKLDGSKVEFIFYLDATLNLTAQDKALVLDKYYYNGDKMVRVDIRGEVKAYELDSASTVSFANVAENTLYSYSMSGAEIELDAVVGPTVPGAVYGEVTDIYADSKSIEIADDVENLSVDADTYIYDMTDLDNPVYVTDFSTISEGDYVFALEGDDDGIADFIFIVDEDDFAYDWDNGGTILNN